MSYKGTHNVVESFEDRQWRQLLEEAKKRLLAEEDEWSQLMARARSATENEEREWQRLRMRADAKSSGAFPAQPGPHARGTPPPLRKANVARADAMPVTYVSAPRAAALAGQPLAWP
jgi:hypothetical protein